MPRKPDFFSQMTRDELEKLEALAREPSATVKRCHEWLLMNGYTASESAVARWKRNFDESDRQHAAAELADAIFTASNGGAVDVAGGVSLQIAQRLQSALVRGGDDLEFGDLLKAAMAVNATMTTEQRIEKLKAAEEAKKLKAVKAAEAAEKSGASAADVVAVIKRTLGVGK